MTREEAIDKLKEDCKNMIEDSKFLQANERKIYIGRRGK